MVRDAKARGVRVTADVSAHHLFFCDADLATFDPNLRLVPPLRTAVDRSALIRGVADGTIDAIVSDHAPQSVLEKDLPFHEALPGAVALQTVLPMVLETDVPLTSLIARLTTGPAQVLGLPELGRIDSGDFAIVDPSAEWQLARTSLLSKCINTPHLGRAMRGRIDVTVVGGRVVYQRDN